MLKIRKLISTILEFESIALAVVFFASFYFHTHGFPSPDEGWMLQAGKRFFSGEVPYKDFQFVYHPGVIYLQAAAFWSFGISILSSRLAALLNTALASSLLYIIAKKSNFSSSSRIVTISLFVVWGAGHINFIWPVMLCITTGLASVYFWQKWLESNKKREIVYAGIAAALTLVFKQNFGLAILITNAIFILFFVKKEKIKIILYFLSGFAVTISLQILYFYFTNSFSNYLSDMRYLLIERIFLKGVFNSALPWEYSSNPISKLFKIIIYTAPLLISLVGFLISKSKKNLTTTYYAILAASYYGLSIRPTTDYVHLTPLVAFTVFYVCYASEATIHKKLKFIGRTFAVLLLILGLYSSLFKNYYRWDTPLSKQTILFENSKILVHTDQISRDAVESIITFFKNEGRDDEYLFVYSFAPTFNFIIDKKNPTRFDYLHTGVLNEAVEEEVITTLKQKNLRYVLTDVEVEKENDRIGKYIFSEYAPLKKYSKYTIWERK